MEESSSNPFKGVSYEPYKEVRSNHIPTTEVSSDPNPTTTANHTNN